jgi:hypothetical protein
MTKRELRKDYEAAIGAVIARFNDIEVALISLIAGFVGDHRKGEAIGWTIGFEQKLRVVVALARIDGLDEESLKRLMSAVKAAGELSSSVRNQVAHMEVWENPFDDSIGLRKGSVNLKDGFNANHLTWSAAGLEAKADEIAAVAADLHAITAVLEFEPVVIPEDENAPGC